MCFTITDSQKGGAVVFVHAQTEGHPGGIDNGATFTLDGGVLTAFWETAVPSTSKLLDPYSISADYCLISNNKPDSSCFIMNSGSIIVGTNRKQAISNNRGTVIINGGTIDIDGDYSIAIDNRGILTINGGTICASGKGSIGIKNQYGIDIYVTGGTEPGSAPSTGNRWIEEVCLVNGGTISTGGEGSVGLVFENILTIINGDISSTGENAVSIMGCQNKRVKSKYDPPKFIGGKIIAGGCVMSYYDGTPASFIDYEGKEVSVNNTIKELTFGYSDVDPGSWYAHDVYQLTYAGIFNGYLDNTFRPQGLVTRAELIALLARCSEEDLSLYENATPSFSDIGPSEWCTLPIAWGADSGIIYGYSSSFRPQDNITREQLVTMLYRYTAYKEMPVVIKRKVSLQDFSDAANVSDWAVHSMQWAIDAGIIQGRGNNKIAPKEFATRAETAVLLMRLRKNNK